MAVSAFGDGLGERFKLRGGDEAQAIGDLFRAGDVESLAAFDGVDEDGGFKERVVGAGVEPGHAAAHDLDAERAGLEVAAVEVGDLELAARGGLER